MSSVFLSYHHEDAARARLFAQALERAGHSVWWDLHIKTGAQYSKEIDRALKEADAIVVLWSERSIDSAWVRDEAAAGRDTGRLVPVSIDRTDPPLGFRQFQTIDMSNWKGRGKSSQLQLLLDDVAGMSGSTRIPQTREEKRLPRPLPNAISRRTVVVSGGTVALLAAGGVGYGLYRRGRQDEVPAEVAPLLLQAKQLMNQNTREGQNQAIGLYQRAVQIAPDYADGWGRLGYAHGVLSHYRERPEALAHKARAEAAGRRALELDPDSAFGELALSAALPFIGHWAERERRLLRALSLRPNEDEVLILLGVALQFMGRATEAVPLYQRVKHKPFTPAEYNNYIRALWSAGRLPELDQAISDAASLYPTQASIWFTRLGIAMYSGQVSAVMSLLSDVQSRPGIVSEEQANRFSNVARAIQGRDPVQVDAVIAEEKARARLQAVNAEYFIRDASALGRLDDAFAVADAYYFGHGFVIPDYNTKESSFSPEQRQTRLLFEPVTKPMRSDPRFERLVKELGFDRYWRESRRPPDYRHVSGL